MLAMLYVSQEASTPYTVRRLEASDLLAFRALHDGCLQVRYDDEFYNRLLRDAQRGTEDEAPSCWSQIALVAVDAASGALVGGLSARQNAARPQAAADCGASPKAWAWRSLLLPLEYLARALKYCMRGGGEERAEERLLEEPGAAAEEAYIMTLCVSQSARRMGVGKALVCALVADLMQAPDRGGGRCTSLGLHMLEGNTAATHLYTSLGFKRGEVFKSYYFFAGEYHDAVFLSLELPSKDPRAGEEPHVLSLASAV